MLDVIAPSLLVAVAVQIFCQLFKVVLYSARDRRFAPEYFVTAGGFPSAHAAFVSALTASVAIRSGMASDLFAVAFVFSAIVTYDAYRLRGHVQEHARRLNLLSRRMREITRQHGGDADRSDAPEPPISEMVGHSLGEIVVGVAFGIIVAVLVLSLL